MKKLGIIVLLSLSSLYAAQEQGAFPFEFANSLDKDGNCIVTIKNRKKALSSFVSGVMVGACKESPKTGRRVLRTRSFLDKKSVGQDTKELESNEVGFINASFIESEIVYSAEGTRLSSRSEAFFPYQGKMLSRLKYNLDGTEKK